MELHNYVKKKEACTWTVVVTTTATAAIDIIVIICEWADASAMCSWPFDILSHNSVYSLSLHDKKK